MATTIVTKNSSTAAAVPTAAQLVQGELAVNVADKRLYTEDSVGGIVELGTNPSAEIVANGGIALPDNGKATFGAGDDLQIYHDGSASYIVDAGAGDLTLQSGNDLLLRDPNAQPYLNANQNAGVQVFYNGLQKLATTSTGIDVTGTATMDGLIVDAVSSNFQSTGATAISLIDTDVTNDPFKLNIENGGRDGRISAWQDIIFSNTGGTLARFDNGGDISFYEDTGTTAKLFWDASAESLGVGTSTPTFATGTGLQVTSGSFASVRVNHSGSTGLDVSQAGGGAGYLYLRDNADLIFGTNNTERMRIDSAGTVQFKGGTTDNAIQIWENNSEIARIGGSSGKLNFLVGNTTTPRMTIDSAGNVGIGTSSPAAKLHIESAASNEAIRINTSTGSNAAINYYVNDTIKWTTQALGDGTDAYRFYNFAAGEAMRIDSANNLLVGTTDDVVWNNSANSAADNGHNLRDDGRAGFAYYNATANANATVNINRTGSDGDLIRLFKSGTAVGSIGSSNTDLYIGSTDHGIKFHDISNAIMPWVPSSNTADSSGTLDLGTSLYKFKDLYLSGTVNLTGGKISSYAADASAPYFADAGNVGIRLSQAGIDDIVPCSYTGADRDDAINLGSSGARFRDLYLSGGVHLGGTATANKLDSYEEGTFAGTLTSSVGSLTMNTSFVQMTYTKVGQLVTIFGNVVLSSVSTPSGNLRLTGLPFVCLNGTQNSERSGFAVYCTALGASTTGLNGLIIAGESQVRLTNFTGTSNADTGATLMQAGSSLTFNFSYQAA